jgi:hypothetical protein
LRESFERVQNRTSTLQHAQLRRPSLGKYPTLPRSQAWLSKWHPTGIRTALGRRSRAGWAGSASTVIGLSKRRLQREVRRRTYPRDRP